MTRPLATVSVDVDPVDLHLVGYGVRGLPPDPLAYTAALPRLLEVFARHGVRATLFVVARDAAAQGASLRSLVAAGHEVASHTTTHPLALSRLPRVDLDAEIAGSRAALERACGAEVVGFRAPNFDLGESVLEALVTAGYRYDASGYPTPWLLPARLLLALKSRAPGEVMRLRLWPGSFERLPGRAGALREFPVSVTPRLRLPVYHTARYLMSEAAFLRHLDGFARRQEPLSYPLHAVDALGLEEDRVDARLGGHPGMDRPLAMKLELLDRTLAAIAARFETVTFREHLERLTGAA